MLFAQNNVMTIRSFRQSVQQPTLCAASYWRAGLYCTTNDGDHIAGII